MTSSVRGAGRDPAGVLHAEVVLVGEEVRQLVVADVLAQHGAGGGRPGMQGVGPVLDPDPGAEQRMVDVGDVAGGEDVRVVGAQPPVDQDAVVHPQAGLLGQARCPG